MAVHLALVNNLFLCRFVQYSLIFGSTVDLQCSAAFCAIQTWGQTLSVELPGEVARVPRVVVEVVRVVNIDMVGRIGKDCRAGCQS